MRRMSFAMTTEQVRNRTKTVTRRLGWACLKVGDRLLAVDKLRTKAAQILGVIEVVSIRDERLWEIYATGWTDYRVTPSLVVEGHAFRPVHEQVHETTLEGFGNFTGVEFAEMFQRAHGLAHDDFDVRRIEFRYVDACWYCAHDWTRHESIDGEAASCLACEDHFHVTHNPDRHQHTLVENCRACDKFWSAPHGMERV